MASLENFEVKDGCAYYRPSGPVTTDIYIAMLRRCLDACLQVKATKLLLDSTKLSSPPRSTIDRYRIASEIAKFWDKSIRLAIVNPPGVAPPDDFAQTVAFNRGMRVAIFTSEPAAVEWLKK